MSVISEIVSMFTGNKEATAIDRIRAKQSISCGTTLDDICSGKSLDLMTIKKLAILDVSNDKLETPDYRVMVVDAVVNGNDVTFNTSSSTFINGIDEIIEEFGRYEMDVEEFDISINAIKSKNYAGVFYKPVIKDVR